MTPGERRLPTWLKWACTVFTAVLVPCYWSYYGPANFLWFCDIALFLTVVALWRESRFLASMQAVAMLGPQAFWIADFFGRMLVGRSVLGITEYMFDPAIPVWIRALSSFHGWLPILLGWMVLRLGYDRRAWLVQTLLAWVVLTACFGFTPMPPPPSDWPQAAVNVNWVFGPGRHVVQTWMPGWAYWLGQLIFYPAVIYGPTHAIVSRLMRRSA